MNLQREPWMKDLPHARMQFPDTTLDRCKYVLWKIYTPLHPHVRDISTKLGIVRHEGRQHFLIGKLDASRSLRAFVSFLIEQGFGNHFIAWEDTDEVISLRRTDGFRYQYHLRIFSDGEVRCHYEYTPEYRPIQHLIQVGFEDRTPEFREIVQDWIVTGAVEPDDI
jgi:hypothetical protein